MNQETSREFIPRARAGDEDAIRAVICEETAAFFAADYDRWAACWVQDARTTDVYASQDHGTIVHRGWDDVGAHMKHVIDTDALC